MKNLLLSIFKNTCFFILGFFIISSLSSINSNLTVLQNQNKYNHTVVENSLKEVVKPSYYDLKAHTVYLVQQEVGTRNGGVGTGVVIKITENETHILTNNHVCTWEEGTVCFVYDNGEKYQIESVLHNNGEFDAQVVKTHVLVPNKEAIIGIKDVVAQDNVYMVGNNNGNFFMYSEGTVSGFSKENNLIVGMPSGPGNSGSGIFTKDEYLTGLLYAGQVFNVSEIDFSLDTSHGIAVNSHVLRLFLKDYFSE